MRILRVSSSRSGERISASKQPRRPLALAGLGQLRNGGCAPQSARRSCPSDTGACKSRRESSGEARCERAAIGGHGAESRARTSMKCLGQEEGPAKQEKGSKFSKGFHPWTRAFVSFVKEPLHVNPRCTHARARAVKPWRRSNRSAK